MARHATAHAEGCHGEGGGRHTVIVGLSHQALLDGLGTAGTPDGQRLPAATARRMACDAGSSPPSTAPTLRCSTSVAVPAPSAPGYATSRPPVTAAVSGPAATGRERSPKPITESMKVAGTITITITIGHDPDRTPWPHSPDGRPPLRGQRRQLLRQPGHPKTHLSGRSDAAHSVVR
jgi:hypothetical protein